MITPSERLPFEVRFRTREGDRPLAHFTEDPALAGEDGEPLGIMEIRISASFSARRRTTGSPWTASTWSMCPARSGTGTPSSSRRRAGRSLF